MTAPNGSDKFYGTISVFRGFARLMDPSLYAPLPSDWSIGVADIVELTKAIAQARYKAVNMAGAAVIAAVTNALEGREFPFVFGGDGASFAVAPDDLERARQALAATAAWVKKDLDLEMRVALVPITAIRAQGLDVRVARFGPSPNLSYAMFSGGGLGFAESRHEARRICGHHGAARNTARPDRAVVPVRGDTGGARPDPRGTRHAGPGWRSRRLSPADRGHRRAGRAQPRFRAAGAAGRSAAALAAGRCRIRGAGAPRRRLVQETPRECSLRPCWPISSCVSASRSVALYREPIYSRSSRIPISGNTTTACGWLSTAHLISKAS